MADILSSEIKSLQNFSQGDSKEIAESVNFNFSSKFCEIENEEITDLEKCDDYKLDLEERLKRLQTTMILLRKQLAEERYLWKKQLDETIQGCTCEHQMSSLESSEVFDTVKNTEMPEDKQFRLRDSITSQYEGKLTNYQELLVKSHAEKRANLRRQISINNYKRRLLEVENMCNLELLRVKQSVQYLQPLQVIASEWNLHSRNEASVAKETSNIQIEEPCHKAFSSILTEEEEETLPVESLASQFDSDMNEVLTKMQSCSLKFPHTSSASGVWQIEGDVIGAGRQNCATWCSSEYFSAPVAPNINLS